MIQDVCVCVFFLIRAKVYFLPLEFDLDFFFVVEFLFFLFCLQVFKALYYVSHRLGVRLGELFNILRPTDYQ